MSCPADKGFENRVVSGQPQCAYKYDTTKLVNLTPIEWVPYNWQYAPPPPPTVDSLRTSNPGLYAKYKTESDRATGAIDILVANLNKQKRIDDAFRGLQAAENARAMAPGAYQQARNAYYTLLNGDTWKSSEQERVAQAEVDPGIQQFRRTLADVQTRQSQQQKTIDVVDGLRDKVLSIKDDFKYSTDTLQRQVTKIKDQITFDRRKRVEQSSDSKWDLLDKGLNYAIIAVLLLVVWKIYQTYFAGPSSGSSSTPPTPAPSTAVK